MSIPVELMPQHHERDDSLRLPCPQDSQQPLTVFVRHHVLHDKHIEFENWCNEINAIARTYEGFISTEIIKPVCYTDDEKNANANDTTNRNRASSVGSTSQISDEYISIVRFQNYNVLKIWMDSDDRKRMLRRTNEFSNEQSTYSYHSLEHWFPSNINSTNPTTTGNTKPPSGPPPKWKMTIFVTAVIYSQTLWIPRVTKAILPNMNMYGAGFLNTLLIVALVTYILFPITTRILAFWLFPHDNYKNKLKELLPKKPYLPQLQQLNFGFRKSKNNTNNNNDIK